MAARLLDTNVVSYLLKNHRLATAYRPHLIGFTLLVSFQTVAELLEGALLAGWGATKRAALESHLAAYTVVYPDRFACDHWSAVRVARRSRPVSTADAWVAATALAAGVELVTHNPADFVHIPGLVVITEAP